MIGTVVGAVLSTLLWVVVVHLWQPTLETQPAEAPGVAEVARALDLDLSYLPQGDRLADDVVRLSGVASVDLTDRFDRADRPIFFDGNHTNEAGARILAEAIHRVIAPLLDGREARR